MGRVVKKWVNLNSTKGAAVKTSLKDTAYNSPRAMLYFYFGEKTVGTAAIEQETTAGNDA